uniref:Adaptive-response sensory-kinase SasA n=1 Tax=Oscillatoriales cyanobacterium SpSt-402 TaxID=2282168 RepID=A0A832M402_9CYAN
MQVSPEKNTNADTPLQLLLFVDKRPSSREQVRQVRSALKERKEECDFEVQFIDVTEQPYLAEYFRLIATPALIKIHPEPRQTLAGSNLVQQLEQWWPQWQRSAAEYLAKASQTNQEEDTAVEKVLLTMPNQSQWEGRATGGIPPTQSSLEVPSANLSDRADNPSLVKSVSYSVEQIQLSDEIFRLRREKEELQHQLQFKDQIISMLAHDLRNPLTAASIALETLEMGYNSKVGSESRLTPTLTLQLLKHARTQTRVIDRLITDILQAARGTGTELQIQPQKLDLGALCLDVLQHMEERFQSKALHVEKDIPSDLPTVLADQERIRQVLINLIDNAVKYTPVGGTIQLSALHRTTQKIQISVCDNGPGIPIENQERIFEERFRLKRDEDKDGYGIGLSLCQRIIRAHYGRIWVDSTSSQGSCFHFTLPVFQV